jgi:hypothetical protein
VILVLLLGGSTQLSAQQKHLVANGVESLAWWQMNPHMGHLWATTCPGDTTWRPGEGTTPDDAVALVKAMRKRIGYGTVTLDSIIPLYPRKNVRPVCANAVTADINIGDLKTYHDVQGLIGVSVRELYTGMRLRDEFTFRLVEYLKYPDIQFKIDSLSNVVQRGDTTYANTFGTFLLRGARQRMVVPIKITNEKDGIRVVGKFQIAARDLLDVYGMSRYKLGLGVGTDIWKLLHMGFDIVLSENGMPGIF